METDASELLLWRSTTGAEPCAVKAASTVLNGGDEETCGNVTRLVPTQLRQRLTPGVRASAGTSRHSGEGCKSQTVKVEPTTLAPSHAQALVTVSAKR
jgi:hypothetical protein